ncbi:hypothetical protein KBD49_11525 [Myxococcota bacterium]|mgnify:CR=1 FL=1|nr:hypothetical protein [Myxococcota bacterium]
MSRGLGRLGVLGIVLVVVLAAAGGWYAATRWGTTSTKEAREMCSREGERVVTTRGLAGDSVQVPLTDYGIYKILDDDGHLWVLSRRGVPGKGSKVKVKGRLFATGDLAGTCGQEGWSADLCRTISGLFRTISSACVLVEDARD